MHSLAPGSDGQQEEHGDQEGEFESYSNLGTQREMLEDEVRTKAFRDAIFQACQGQVVLEVGCGTGILAVFAAQAGALKVIAVEASPDMAEHAQEVVEHNGCAEVVSVVTGYVEDVAEEVDTLLEEANLDLKVGVLISEWMGFMLVCEGMFPSVAFARDRWLMEGGCMIPQVCKVCAAPFSHQQLIDRMTEYWKSRPYGVDLSCLACEALSQFLTQPVIEVVHETLAPATELLILDCSKATAEDVEDQCVSFECSISQAGPFHGFAVWFTCELLPGISFSTGPETVPTHWSQTLLFLSPGSEAFSLGVLPGNSIRGELYWAVRGGGIIVKLLGTVFRETGNDENESDAEPFALPSRPPAPIQFERLLGMSLL
eukprot:CAMPEP_0172666286 /NCGR_PEP_ID=MMETSP1074-20121228/7714_1 /TAXON_ID=2916 /ORGANISM="Ceratium fusus, Strain PA161109" /LENGTH=371 /DNA_ID=CAMNT_0013482651 /DNA_START=253 /DNA_END=1368 /DNA_ORIENTATION=+